MDEYVYLHLFTDEGVYKETREVMIPKNSKSNNVLVRTIRMKRYLDRYIDEHKLASKYTCVCADSYIVVPYIHYADSILQS